MNRLNHHNKVPVTNCIRSKIINWTRVLMLSVMLLSVLFTGCKKLVETPLPSESVSGNDVYSTDATAIGVLNGMYTLMNGDGQPFQGTSSISLFTGLSADELVLYNGISSLRYLNYYKNALSATNIPATGSELWSPLYNYVFICNAAIEGLNSKSANSLTPAIKQQLLGEARFMRAFFYFYLVNLFGDLPLCVGTDPEINTKLSRSPKSKVYELIVEDLKAAESLLSAGYLDNTLRNATTERVRPSKWAAAALLARTYLYMGYYLDAEAASSLIIGNTDLFGPLPALNDVFLKNSREAIWQLQPTVANFNTQEAQTIIIPQDGLNDYNNFVYASKNLLNSFEPDDQRKVNGNWINATIYPNNSSGNDTVYYSNKYKLNAYDPNITTNTGTSNMSEYFMVLRLGEQYLIRSEARAQQDNLNGALEDLNAIRVRAGLQGLTITDKNQLLSTILHERQVELFLELGQRWLDLKRTGAINTVMSTITPMKAGGSQWQSYQQLYPLPLVSDLQNAPNLVQNNGYN
jgi:hypothetical protein